MENITLSPFQRTVLEFVATETESARQRFHSGKNVATQIRVAAGYAFALYQDLSAARVPPTFSPTMLENREVPPSDPEFFRSLHAIQDLVAWIRSSSQNPR